MLKRKLFLPAYSRKRWILIDLTAVTRVVWREIKRFLIKGQAISIGSRVFASFIGV
jgi:hypothetical protein